MLKAIKILLALAALFAVKAHAQTPIVQRMEGEIRVGLTTPLGDYYSGTAYFSGTLGIECRYNFKGTPWDCGVMYDLSTVSRGYEYLYNDGHNHRQSNLVGAFAAVGEYNLRQGRRVNPFVGTALGVALNSAVGDVSYQSRGTSMLFAPRVGVELFHHLRLMAQFNVCRKGYNNLSITIGLVVGGRPKKQ